MGPVALAATFMHCFTCSSTYAELAEHKFCIDVVGEIIGAVVSVDIAEDSSQYRII
jgi:hypothetical protein